MSDIAPAGDSGGAGTPSAESGSPTATATPGSSSTGTIAPAGSGPEEPKGPVPYDRFSEVNTKLNALKWAESYDSGRVQQQSQFFQWLDADPEGAFRYMEDYLSRAGVLKRQQQQQAQAKDERPQPDVVVPETGQRFYSAEAAERLAEWMARQSVGPVEERLQSLEASHTNARVSAQAQAQLAEANTWPYFQEHQMEVLKAMEADRRLSLEGAYQRVVLPKLRQLERQAVLSEINQKSQASTVNPGSQSASASVPASKQSWAEVFRREMAKRGGQI